MPFACENGWIGGSLIPDLAQIGRKTRLSRPTDVQQAVVLIDYYISLSTDFQSVNTREDCLNLPFLILFERLMRPR